MQETWNFTLSNPTTSSNSEELTSLLKRTLESNENELRIFLSLYTKIDGAVAEFPEFEKLIEQKSIQEGSISILFNKVFFNACLNINETEKDRIILHYLVDQERAELLLTGPFVPERGMDDI
ncbi:hypothetical protein IFO69_11575 [Echinicola sp. CAU 1574]|uniref:Uncharacterized protein n=1 Tax=Echinicola arenosa TaxID=2774144 RepID=A0ABR9AL13_9BACT|nr:hypothetical protein [Echinicola arenosa]MBD8489385.1 hypothetical protein [Echinicola arenosa]